MNRQRPKISSKQTVPQSDSRPSTNVFQRCFSLIPFLVVIGVAPMAIYFRVPWVAMIGCGISFVILMSSSRFATTVPMIVWTIVLFLFALRMLLNLA